MNPNTRSVLSSWFVAEERGPAAPAQLEPDYVYAPVHPSQAKKLEKRGAGRGRGAHAKAPRSAGPSPIRPSAARAHHYAADTEEGAMAGPRSHLRDSKDGYEDNAHRSATSARNYNTEAFDYHGTSANAGEPSWRAARSLPGSASSTPKKYQAARQRRSRFKEHLSPEEVEQGLKDGTLLEGVLRVNYKRMRLAYVSVEGFDKDILIDGIFARNRSFEGDTVVIRLNDPSEWEVIKDDKDEEDEDEAERPEDEEELAKLDRPVLDDSLLDATADTDDDIGEVTADKNALQGEDTSSAEKKVEVQASQKEDYEEGADAEEASSAAGPDPAARGWWQPSAAAEPAGPEVTVEVEVATTREEATEATALPASTTTTTSSQPPSTPVKAARGKRCWKCQETGHISRDCTNPARSAEQREKKPQQAKKDKPSALEVKEGDETRLRRTAKVVAITKTNHVEEMVGYLKPCGLAEEELGKGNFFAFFVPLEKRMPRMLVPVKRLSSALIGHPSELTTNLFVCKLTSWPTSSAHPKGELVKNMGRSGDMEVELRVLLEDNGIDWEDSFAPEVLDCLPRIPPLPARWAIPKEEVASRRDLRRERIFTIDPATAKDMDDAVSCKPLPDGTYEVGVHIADVTYFVKANSPLDEEARKRATTVYMVHRSIPMLPRLLSDNMCSLVPGEDRLSFSVTWRMDKAGNVLDEPWFGRSIIRSCVKMSYEAAQEMLDGRFTEPPPPEPLAEGEKPAVKRGSIFVKDLSAPEHRAEDVVEDVRVLNAMAESLRQKRFEDGSLTLDDAKMYFCLDDEKMPVDVGTYVRTASHFLIEEFMLLANKSVAKRIHAAFPDRALLRRHPAPNDNKLADFIAMCGANSIDFDTKNSKGFQRSLTALNKLSNPDIATVVTRLAMKPMCVAKYTCTDEDAEEGAYKHYALAFDHYTHFTSPIRRYADVIVHRLLDACLQREQAPLEKEDLISICDNCNMRKTKADKAQDKCDLVFLCTLLKNHPPKDLDATVITVNSRSFEVYVPLYGVEKMARVEDLPLAKFDHDKKNQTLYLHWRPANGPAAAEESPEQAKKSLVQEIKPFTRLRVRLYPDLQRRPIDVRLAIVPPEGAAVPDNYYDAPVQEPARPKTPARQQGHGRQPQHHQQPQQQHFRPDHEAENHDHDVEKWINGAREDEAQQREQLTERIKLFLNDASQAKLHLPNELSSFERLLAHEIAEDFGLYHQSANYFCSETGTKQRRLTLFKQPRPAGGRSRSLPSSAPDAEAAAANGDAVAAGAVKTPKRPKVRKPRNPKPVPTAATPAPEGEAQPAPDAADAPAPVAIPVTKPKKKPFRKTKEGAKERTGAVKDQLEAGGEEDGAPTEVRTKVHRPKRTFKKRTAPTAAPAAAPAAVAQQVKEPAQRQPEEAA